MVALLVGGISFDNPPELGPTEPAGANTSFTLYRDRVTALRATDPHARRYVLYFNESLRGLSVGAPVTFLGLPAGEVSSVGLAFDAASATIRPRVVVTFSPERLLAYGNVPAEVQAFKTAMEDEQKRASVLRRLVEERGLRAQLKSGNLLTGQMYVALDYYPGAPKVKLDLRKPEIVLPVEPGTFAVLEAKLTSILDKIDKMPLEAIGKDLSKDLASLDVTLASATKLLNNADAHIVPPLKTALEDAHNTLVAVERAMNNVNDAPRARCARSRSSAAPCRISPGQRAVPARATDQLERQPSSVIRGQTDATSGGDDGPSGIARKPVRHRCAHGGMFFVATSLNAVARTSTSKTSSRGPFRCPRPSTAADRQHPSQPGDVRRFRWASPLQDNIARVVAGTSWRRSARPRRCFRRR
jgi:paraquat-inducible protein B